MAELYALKNACIERAIECYKAKDYDMCAFYKHAAEGFQMRIDRIPMSAVVKSE